MDLEEVGIGLNSPFSVRFITARQLSDMQEHQRLIILDIYEGSRPARTISGAQCVPISAIDTIDTDGQGLPVLIYGVMNLLPARELRRNLESYGIWFGANVVVTTQSVLADGSLDILIAARFAWALCCCGVKRVSLLCGGTPSWRELGLPVESPSEYETVNFFRGIASPGAVFPLSASLCADTEVVERAVASGDAVLCDVRSLSEFQGKSNDYPYSVPLGRIPGAIWAHWGPSTYVCGDLCDSRGFVHSWSYIRSIWESSGIWKPNDDRMRIFYCGSGWRSALAWCIAQANGMTDCCSYDGGWLEWSSLHPRSSSHGVVID